MDLQRSAGALGQGLRPSDLYSVAEAALRARVNPFTIWKWIRQGRIKAYGSAGCLRVSLADLLPTYKPKKKARAPIRAKVD
ncbi:MAG: helix-turn-helix domain-containing protein [Candidatus Solibacter sp.]